MSNQSVLIIIAVIIVLIAVLFVYIDIHKSREDTKELLQNFTQQLIDVMKIQSANDKFRLEIDQKRNEILENIVFNLENKINAQKIELDWYTSNFEGWKEVYNTQSEKAQAAWLIERGGEK